MLIMLKPKELHKINLIKGLPKSNTLGYQLILNLISTYPNKIKFRHSVIYQIENHPKYDSFYLSNSIVKIPHQENLYAILPRGNIKGGKKDLRNLYYSTRNNKELYFRKVDRPYGYFKLIEENGKKKLNSVKKEDYNLCRISRRTTEQECKDIANYSTKYNPTLSGYYEIKNEANNLHKLVLYQDFLGMNCRNYVKKHSTTNNVEIICQITAHLKKMHLNNHIHLDLKPDNTTVRKKNGAIQAYIIDFEHMEKKGTPIGNNFINDARKRSYPYTPLFVLNGAVKKYIKAIDIFSLGITIWEMYGGNYQDYRNILHEAKKIQDYQQAKNMLDILLKDVLWGKVDAETITHIQSMTSLDPKNCPTIEKTYEFFHKKLLESKQKNAINDQNLIKKPQKTNRGSQKIAPKADSQNNTPIIIKRRPPSNFSKKISLPTSKNKQKPTVKPQPSKIKIYYSHYMVFFTPDTCPENQKTIDITPSVKAANLIFTYFIASVVGLIYAALYILNVIKNCDTVVNAWDNTIKTLKMR
jgi:serine/threonine protein kinase